MMTVKPKIIFFFVFVFSSCSLQFVKTSSDKRAPSSVERKSSSIGGLIQKFKYKTTGDFYAPAPVLLSKFSDLLVKIEKGRVEELILKNLNFLSLIRRKLFVSYRRKIRGKEYFASIEMQSTIISSLRHTP